VRALLLLQDAISGARTHGTVTGATATGVFVSFFNGIRGLVHNSALGLAEDQTPEDAFKVGQVCPYCCSCQRLY
jgi:rRNA biogenesis protein RRP5